MAARGETVLWNGVGEKNGEGELEDGGRGGINKDGRMDGVFFNGGEFIF